MQQTRMADSSVSNDLDTCAAAAAAALRLPPFSVQYTHAALPDVLADRSVLAVVGFGNAASLPQGADARYRYVPLQPLRAPAPFEVWRGSGDVRQRQAGEVRWSEDDDYACGVIEVEEAAHADIAAAARHAYCVLGRWLAAMPALHVLRIWNYLDAINLGDGDAERYREFCRGRADGMRGIFEQGFPAATAIGGRDGRRVLRVHWIAARLGGTPMENPRQVSAWRYPRQYGPSAPTFARAMRAPTTTPQLYVSGTAAIIGHASHHRDDLAAQVDETLANFASLLDAAGFAADAHFGPASTLKVYLRNPDEAARAEDLLRARLPQGTALLLLHGDICRRELLVEIDGVQTG
jgi:chorismate lyase/3-hydroxybenzoate synthase